ncbi:hypothetical protein POSPLADRAFT_1050174 [Postia placenta MAD-698-R-SB12]|uniref:Uncharacterized protein n=1 Tax=Postia placenta MAD-698-R-SB12 TaxID=670580 RepID=A0A1X6MM06_9APHY|nr:hypothetical protein POSPLADRAFT_1050174 [Postia placenta MAD-698-R-SB12]OSX57103.1 hypothetical protein POSPLADRAFT_1050174 [Postia placenta MAD-698-R-SB12]
MSFNTYAVYDDQSGHFRYSGAWIHYTLSGNEQLWNSTLSSAPDNPTVLGVYGTILPANGTTRPISSYSIDGASPSTFEPPDNITTRQDNQLFFVSDELSSGQHTLTVSINQVNLHDPVLIDYILIASETSGNAGQATETYRTTSLAGLPTTSAQADALAASSGPPAGPIIGGVVGGVAVLVAAALVVYFFWYRRRHNGYYYHPADDIDHDGKPFAATPYNVVGGGTSLLFEASINESSLATEMPSTANAMLMHQVSTSGSATASRRGSVPPPAASSSTRAMSKAESAGIQSALPRTVYHTDAGSCGPLSTAMLVLATSANSVLAARALTGRALMLVCAVLSDARSVLKNAPLDVVPVVAWVLDSVVSYRLFLRTKAIELNATKAPVVGAKEASVYVYEEVDVEMM